MTISNIIIGLLVIYLIGFILYIVSSFGKIKEDKPSPFIFILFHLYLVGSINIAVLLLK